MSLGQRLEPRLELKLKLELKIVSQTTCPFCGKAVEPIHENFVDSDTDCRMVCDNKKCQQKFQGLLQIFDGKGLDVATYHFLCPRQTIYELQKLTASGGRKRLGEKFLRSQHPEIYFSIIKNFGSYKRARNLL